MYIFNIKYIEDAYSILDLLICKTLKLISIIELKTSKSAWVGSAWLAHTLNTV